MMHGTINIRSTDRPLIVYTSLATAHGIIVNAFKGTINLKHLRLGSDSNLNHSFFEGLTISISIYFAFF
jgi:hypothetical protein